MKGARLLVALVFVVTCLVACGSSYTKADFVTRAEGICLTTTRAIRSLNSPSFTGTPAEQRVSLGGYLVKVARRVSSEARHLSSLRKPPGTRREARLLGRWLAAVRESGNELADLGTAAGTADPTTVARSTAALGRLQVVDLARDYGVRGCAGPSASYAHLPLNP